MKKLCLLITVCLINIGSNAALSNTLRGQNSKWQCAAYDEGGRQWLAQSSFQRAAINKAWQACKKDSNDPGSCETAKAHCEMLIHGRVLRSRWTCSSMDQMGQYWRSDTHNTRNDAVLGARLICQEQSTFPSSCYVRLMTCKNLSRAQAI